MPVHININAKNINNNAAGQVSKEKVSRSRVSLLSGNTPYPNAKTELQEIVDNSPQVRQLKAYQQMADNRFVNVVQRKPTPAPSTGDPGRHFDSFLGSYVTNVRPLKGYGDWLSFYQEAEDTNWIYLPATSYRLEKYYRASQVSLDELKEKDENEREDKKVQDKLSKGDWGDLSVSGELHPKVGEELKQTMLLGKGWEKYDGGLFARISKTFPILDEAITKKEIELTPDLIKKINEVISPLQSKKKEPGDREKMQASQALTELDYAAIVISGKNLAAPFVLGARSRIRHPKQKELATKEEKHGSLPPLGVLNMEVDAYYMDSRGILHADEVKDTPNALADKAKDGGQIGRQIEWLSWDVLNPKMGSLYEKQVHYFVRAPGPKFDSVLSEAVINNLSQLDSFQPGVKFIHISNYHFSPQELRRIYDQAIDWLGKSKPAEMKSSEAAEKYFGDVPTALKTLGDKSLTND